MINDSLFAGPLRIPCCERPVLTSSGGLTLFWIFGSFLLRRWWRCSIWDRPAGRLMCKSLVMATDLGPRNRRWIKAVGQEINCGETKGVHVWRWIAIEAIYLESVLMELQWSSWPWAAATLFISIESWWNLFHQDQHDCKFRFSKGPRIVDNACSVRSLWVSGPTLHSSSDSEKIMKSPNFWGLSNSPIHFPRAS